VPIAAENHTTKLTILSLASLFGEAIWRNYTRQSIGDLYSFGDEILELDDY
jgi:phosphoribosylpyrophosphate synthetase